MDYFTLATGLASLFGFLIQGLDLMPKFARARQIVLSFVVGVFLGSLLRAFDASSIRLGFEITFSSAVVFALVALLAGSLSVAATADEANRREDFLSVSGVIGIGLLLVLIGVGVFTASDANSRQSISVAEFITLADAAEARGDFGKAVTHLESVAARLSAHDGRAEVVKARIEVLRKKEIH